MQRECKQCAVCTTTFTRPAGRSHAQWARMRFCSTRCANAWRAGRQRTHRVTQKRWALAWEWHRSVEDRAELREQARLRKRRAQLTCRLIDRPATRMFVSWYCRSCGDPFVYYAKRAQSQYCTECNAAHHRRPANRRARQNGVRYEVVIPKTVFERDGYRCQLCKRKTHGTFPAPMAATVDHIVPLAKGGPHVYSNVQCACFRCNSAKQDGSAYDQLLLIG